MNVRRAQRTRTPVELLELALSMPVLWPGRTIRLERDSLWDHHGRSTSPQISAAELYHENSKLSREVLPQLAGATVDLHQFRKEFLRRRGDVARRSRGDGFPEADLWGRVLGLAAEDNIELFYAIDPRLVVSGRVLTYEPAAGVFQRVKDLSATEGERLTAALNLLGSEAPHGPAVALLLLLACLHRNTILFGEHGHRRTLVEAGQVAERVRQGAARAGLACQIHTELSHRDVDDIMEVDGVERSVVVALEFWSDGEAGAA